MADRSALVFLDGSCDRALLGGKAAALDRLVGAGQPVPWAAVLTTDAYRRVERDPAVADLVERLRRGAQIDDDAIDQVFLDLALPASVSGDVGALARRLARPVAVRSSATSEDLGQAAFPGQYRTVLDVTGDELEHAARLVWASLWHAAPRRYRAIRGIDDEHIAMAVLVMEMVDAVEAGVLFTRDPVGDQGDVRLEVVAGVGDALVSGAVTPSDHVWPRSSATERAAIELDPAIADIVARGLDLDAAFGAPQDIEFAVDPNGRAWLLQSRPITTLTSRRRTRAGIAEMLPGVLPPLLQHTAGRQVDEGFRTLFAALGGNVPERPFVGVDHSRAVLDLDVVEAATATVPGGSVAELERGYGLERSDAEPTARSSATQTVRVLRHRRAAVLEAEIVTSAVELLTDDDPSAHLDTTSDDELLALWERVQDLGVRTAAAEMGVAALATAAYRGVETTLTRYTEPARAALLTQQLTGQVTGHRGRGSGVLQRSFERLPVPPDPSPDLDWEDVAPTLDPEFRAAWDAALGRSGSRSVFGGPTWSDEPALAWLAYRTPPRAAPEAAADELRTMLPSVPGSAVPGPSFVARRFLRREAADAAALIDRRERTKQALLDLGGIAHRLTVELGARFAAAGRIDSADDVWLLSPAELRSASSGAHPDLLGRRADFERDRLTAASAGGPTDADRGWGASPGRATGRARIVTTPRAGALRRGEILVARTTDAGWAPLFAQAAGIVVEEGGPLSHAAILARELGIPAVVNLPGIVERVAGAGGGATLELDGTTGEVHVDPAPMPVPVLGAPDALPRVGVFVTGLIGASALFGVLVSLTEAVSSDRGVRHIRARAHTPGGLLAATVRDGTDVIGRDPSGLPPRRRFALLAAVASVLAVAAATAGVVGYVSDDEGGRVIALMATASGVAMLAAVAVAAGASWRRWPDVPPVVRRAMPPPLRASARRFWATMPRFHRRWLVALSSTALLLTTLAVAAEPRLRALDERIYTTIDAGQHVDLWGPDWFGMYFGRPQVVVPVALLVALFTIRCRVLALAYPFTIMFGGLLNLGLGALVGRARPPDGAHAGQTDSFPSGHAIEVTLLLGLVPLAIAILFRSRWVGIAVRVVATAVLVVMLADGLRSGSHWPSDHLGGFAIAMTAVVFVHALARMPHLHRSCTRCPALALHERDGPDPGDAP